MQHDAGQRQDGGCMPHLAAAIVVARVGAGAHLERQRAEHGRLEGRVEVRLVALQAHTDTTHAESVLQGHQARTAPARQTLHSAQRRTTTHVQPTTQLPATKPIKSKSHVAHELVELQGRASKNLLQTHAPHHTESGVTHSNEVSPRLRR